MPHARGICVVKYEDGEKYAIPSLSIRTRFMPFGESLCARNGVIKVVASAAIRNVVTHLCKNGPKTLKMSPHVFENLQPHNYYEYMKYTRDKFYVRALVFNLRLMESKTLVSMYRTCQI